MSMEDDKKTVYKCLVCGWVGFDVVIGWCTTYFNDYKNEMEIEIEIEKCPRCNKSNLQKIGKVKIKNPYDRS